MSSIVLTPPAQEPLTLAEAKAWLRVAHDDDDAVIAALIAAARALIEQDTQRALITQIWRIVRDAWPVNGRLAVSPSPLRQVLAARVFDAAGVAQAIDAQSFTLDTAAVPGVLGFLPGALPLPGRALAGIEIDVEAGFGNTGDTIPEPLRQAMRLLLAQWYENRGAEAGGGAGGVRLPAGVAVLIAPFRVLPL